MFSEGHCHLMLDNLQDAYSSYQQALYYLANPKVCPRSERLTVKQRTNEIQDAKLWYGIGILYDRYGSLEHAEEAFRHVMTMQSDFEKANEIYFRLGIIYKQQRKYQESLEVGLPCCHWQLIQANGAICSVFPLHRPRSAPTSQSRRYLVPNWSRA